MSDVFPRVKAGFDAIDRQAGRARIVAKSGAGDVTVITGPTALTFIEIAATGNPLVTVVFPRFRAGTREFYAADSFHFRRSLGVLRGSLSRRLSRCMALVTLRHMR